MALLGFAHWLAEHPEKMVEVLLRTHRQDLVWVVHVGRLGPQSIGASEGPNGIDLVESPRPRHLEHVNEPLANGAPCLLDGRVGRWVPPRLIRSPEDEVLTRATSAHTGNLFRVELQPPAHGPAID